MDLVLASSIIGLPVASLKEELRVGSVKKILVDVSSGSIIGYLAGKGFFGKSQYIDAKDVISIDKAGLVVNDLSNLVPVNEVIKAKKALEENIRIFGMPIVSNRTNKTIGRVDDFAISATNSLLMKFYVKRFLEERIIPRSRVIKITKKSILINEDTSFTNALPEAEVI